MTEPERTPTPGPPPDAGTGDVPARLGSLAGLRARSAALMRGVGSCVPSPVRSRVVDGARRLGTAARRRVPPRRVGHWLLTGFLVVAPSAIWGITTASAQGSLGPHTARYEVTVDGDVTVDLGPLGTLVIDSPLPLALGARVVVQEIPEDVTSIDAATSLDSFAGALEDYVAFFTGPEATVELATRALVLDAARRSALAALLLTAVGVSLRLLVGRERRAELADRVRPHRAAVAGAMTVAVLVATTLAGSGVVPIGGDDDRTASTVFDGTPLEGARITGRLAGVVDTYGGQAVDAWRANEEFYAAADEAVRVAWEERMAADERLTDVRRRLGVLPGGTGDGDEQAPELVTMLVMSDLHCNVGMAEVIGTVLELSGASVVLNGGDTTVNGTAVESYCIQAVDDAVPDGVTVVVADGNHDSAEIAQDEADHGWVVLDGDVVEVDGVRILGDADPRATRIGSGTSLVGEETAADVAARLADTACSDADGVDLLLIHDPALGLPTVTAGCAAAQVSGHYHRREGPVRSGSGTRYTSASSAGARLGQATIGPLAGEAEVTLLRFDPDSRRITDYRLVIVHPDATATVTAPLLWPDSPPRLTPEPALR